MPWVVPVSFTVIQGLVTYWLWRMIVPDCSPRRDPLMALMVTTGSLVIWGLFGAYHLNNWYWELAALK
jgi:hypothetical protein